MMNFNMMIITMIITNRMMKRCLVIQKALKKMNVMKMVVLLNIRVKEEVKMMIKVVISCVVVARNILVTQLCILILNKNIMAYLLQVPTTHNSKLAGGEAAQENNDPRTLPI